ncbi:MAG TPA: glycogen/starch synthase [Pyrinomonadaceae bacterium]|nr:glycogen/starch synthase [Pyrinomonadaceae bacterium]
MRVAILTSEAVPFAKAGGLADVSGALPKALTQLDVDAKLILPLYEQIDRALLNGGSVENVRVEWHGQVHNVRFWFSDAAGAPAYLLETPEFFGRPAIYGYTDDHIRFAFFCRAALALLKYLDWPPDIVHGNDWHCGFAVAELRARRRHDDFFQKTKALFSIHNLSYQGRFDSGDLWWLGFGEPPERDDFRLDRHASALKAGLVAADALSTVSPTYAREIQTPRQGEGLDWLLRARRDRLAGITNGVDYDIWNPETDPDVAANYSAEDLSGKRECKLDLLRRFNLPQEPDRPILANISRLVPQKGYDLFEQISGWILETGSFFIAVGKGEYEDFLQRWHDMAPRQVGIYKGQAPDALVHQVEAGADIFLMPSLFEPCGLNQMYSMRYGTVPIVRATGGLDDTVQQFNPEDGTGTGFKFGPYDAGALLEKIREALYFYARPEQWQKIQRNGMLVDNSWPAAAQKYLELYEEIRL